MFCFSKSGAYRLSDCLKAWEEAKAQDMLPMSSQSALMKMLTDSDYDMAKLKAQAAKLLDKPDDLRVAMVRRPIREIKVMSKLRKVETQADWSPYSHAFVYGWNCLGSFGPINQEVKGDKQKVPIVAGSGGENAYIVSDGSVGTEGAVSIVEGSSGLKRVPGLTSMAAGVVPVKEIEKLRMMHHMVNYDVRLVLRQHLEDGTLDELNEGFVEVKKIVGADLDADPELKSKFLGSARLQGGVGFTEQQSMDMMKEQLKLHGLERPEGMPDFVYVQMLAKKIPGVIIYDAGKDLVVNSGKPPANAFITKVSFSVHVSGPLADIDFIST